jgi:hypothetical protein
VKEKDDSCGCRNNNKRGEERDGAATRMGPLKTLWLFTSDEITGFWRVGRQKIVTIYFLF